MNPPKTNGIIWPIDVVALKGTCYEETGNIGLIFQQKAYPKLNKFKDLIYYPNMLDWRDNKIKRLALNITKVFVEIERAEYLFHAFDIDNFYFNQSDMDVLINYSISINEKKRPQNFIDVKDIRRDFLPPWIERDGMYECTDEASMRYSYAALLFRILIGKLPYQGRLSDDIGKLMLEDMDNDRVVHDLMIDAYMKNSIFLFDENDYSNSIGTNDDEMLYIERWNTLNAQIKSMFLKTFSKNNLLERSFYSIENWHDVLVQAFGG